MFCWDTPPEDANAFVHQYTDTLEPWSRLDTLHRNLERFALAVDYSPGDKHASLERLVAAPDRNMPELWDKLRPRLPKSLIRSDFNISELTLRVKVFNRFLVAPAMQNRKVAYVLVDALRYEMAVDLAASLDHDGRLKSHL